MNNENSVLDQLASGINKAGGLLDGIDTIIDFEAIMNRNQSKVDEIVNKQQRTNKVPENLVPEIRAKMESKNPNDAKVSGKIAEVENGINQVLRAGGQPSHAVIEDDKFEIFGRKDEGNEPDR